MTATIGHIEYCTHAVCALKTFLFHGLKEGAEGELSASTVSSTQSFLFQTLYFLVILYVCVLSPFSILCKPNEQMNQGL